jgi:hypothetical protein
LDQALYEETYRDITKQLFPHGLPQWITEDGRRRAHSQIAEITLRSMRDTGRFDGDSLVEARKATGDKVTDR